MGGRLLPLLVGQYTRSLEEFLATASSRQICWINSWRSTKVIIIQDGQRPRQWRRLGREESCCSDLRATLSTHRRGIRRRVRVFPPHQHRPLLHVLGPSNHSRILDRLEEK